MVLDARDKEIALGSHVRYVDTGTIGEVVDLKTENDIGWVRIKKLIYGIAQNWLNCLMKRI